LCAPRDKAREVGLQVSESKGRELYRLAMRSRNLSDFKKRIRQAKASYYDASKRYKSEKQRGNVLRCRGWISFLQFFLATNARDKKRLLDNSWHLAKLALAVFRRDANGVEFANTYDQLSSSVALGYDFHWDPKNRAKILQ
jgi:hypothetical protein